MRLARWLPWAAVAALFVALLCHEWYGADIWYHLYLGGRVASTLSPQPSDNLLLHQAGFVNFYWLFQIAVRGVYELGGIYAVSFLFMALWAAALGFWLRTSRLWDAGVWGAAFALVAVLVCQTRFEERPEVLSYVFLAIQIHWLASWKIGEIPRNRDFLRFALVEALWANVHGYFVFGPALVGLRIASAAFPASNRSQPGWLGLWKLLGLAALASITSPFGIRNWTGVVALGRVLHQLRFAIQELLPPWAVPAQVWTVDVFWCAWAAVLVVGIRLAFTAGLANLFALLLAACGLCLSTIAYRNIPLLVFFSAPLLGALRPNVAPAGRDSPNVTRGVTLLAAGLAAWVVTGGFYRSQGAAHGFGIRESPSAYPVSFAAYLRSTDFHGSVFNSMADGGYLEFHFPDLRLFSDSRVTDPGPVREYFGALHGTRRFHELQSRYGFDAALLCVAESPDLIASLYREGAWRVAYADLHRVFFVNVLGSPGAGAPLLDPVFYHGEDLSLPQNHAAAIIWVALFARLDDRASLLLALRQFSAAPQIPQGLVTIALHYGWRRSDPEITAAAQAMQAKAFQTRPISSDTLNRLMDTK